MLRPYTMQGMQGMPGMPEVPFIVHASRNTRHGTRITLLPDQAGQLLAVLAGVIEPFDDHLVDRAL